MNIGRALRLGMRAVAWSAVLGPAFVAVVLACVLWVTMDGRVAAEFASMATIGIVLLGKMTVPSGLLGAALAALISAKKSTPWSPIRWGAVGTVGGAAIGVGASLVAALAESGDGWLHVLEQGYWFSSFFTVAGGVLGGIFCRYSWGDLEDTTSIARGV